MPPPTRRLVAAAGLIRSGPVPLSCTTLLPPSVVTAAIAVSLGGVAASAVAAAPSVRMALIAPIASDLRIEVLCMASLSGTVRRVSA